MNNCFFVFGWLQVYVGTIGILLLRDNLFALMGMFFGCVWIMIAKKQTVRCEAKSQVKKE